MNIAHRSGDNYRVNVASKNMSNEYFDNFRSFDTTVLKAKGQRNFYKIKFGAYLNDKYQRPLINYL